MHINERSSFDFIKELCLFEKKKWDQTLNHLNTFAYSTKDYVSTTNIAFNSFNCIDNIYTGNRDVRKYLNIYLVNYKKHLHLIIL